MESTKFVLGTTALLLTLAAGHAGADKTVPIWERDADDQSRVFEHNDLAQGAVLLDQYSDKLSPSTRWMFVRDCFHEGFKSGSGAEKAVRWALCAEDLKGLDLKKLGVSENWQTEVEEYKKIGAELEAEAKDDPGVALILKQVESAKADWKDFEAKNHDAITLYQVLKVGVRSSKSNDKSFDGCWDATRPAFVSAVKATKFHWDNEGDNPVPGRIAEVIGRSPANYYAVANFGMCSYATHVTGGILAGAALNAKGGVFGWRTMLMTKLTDPKFKPKFTDRSYTWDTNALGKLRGGHDGLELSSFPWPGGPMRTQTGVIKTMKKDGDDTTVSFTGTIVEDCLDWKETGKIRTWDTAGDPVYERKCLKRGRVEDDAPDDGTFGTKLTEGFAKGVGVAFYGWFAEEVYNDKAKKFVSILSVAVKGSPAETPIKE